MSYNFELLIPDTPEYRNNKTLTLEEEYTLLTEKFDEKGYVLKALFGLNKEGKPKITMPVSCPETLSAALGMFDSRSETPVFAAFKK